MRHRNSESNSCESRRGSTLVVVIALLGLLAFLGVVFFTFAAQERASADYFSEAAKSQIQSPDSVWPHLLRQVLVGPSAHEKASILYSPTQRHSLVTNLFGDDVYPQNGTGVEVQYDQATGVPVVVNGFDNDLVDFVDSPVARRSSLARDTPGPDVDYSYPDINNLFLAYRGWAVREGADGVRAQVPVIIPSYFRPQYMRFPASDSGTLLSTGFRRQFGPVTAEVITNPHWAYSYTQPAANQVVPCIPDQANRNAALFGARSFRPHPSHLAGFGPDRTPVFRYLTDDEAASPGISLLAGGFPFLPAETGSGIGNGIAGDLGVWTGSPELAYELDADNDGDGITEGIWLDLNYPIQEFHEPGGPVRTYAVLHSVTIYDLDGLLNLNVHGNLAGLPRTQRAPDGSLIQTTLARAASDGVFSRDFLSQSLHGLGPNEVNPEWALKASGVAPAAFQQDLPDEAIAHFARHFGHIPADSLEQANMEWLWLLTGRGDFAGHVVHRATDSGRVTYANATEFRSILNGRWGDAQMLFTALQQSSGSPKVVDLPRPGRAGLAFRSAGGDVSFGGRAGFDDNGDWREGEGAGSGSTLYRRPFGHPVSFSGRGRRTNVNTPVYDRKAGRFTFNYPDGDFPVSNPLVPFMVRSSGENGTDRLPGYINYSGTSAGGRWPRYAHGPDQIFSGTNSSVDGAFGDDLSVRPLMNELFEDPLESVFDHDAADHVNDSLFAIGDTVSLQWPKESVANMSIRDTVDQISTRLSALAPVALSQRSPAREMFTTHSSALRQSAFVRNTRRAWEFSADADRDGNPEFPPAFGDGPLNGAPYSETDPFRAPVRRLLTNEMGELGELAGGLPLSLNHILDVDRTAPGYRPDASDYARRIQRSHLRFRELTEHPVGSDVIGDSNAVMSLGRIPTLEISNDRDRNTVSSAGEIPFPPRLPAHQEFWARRDRQQLARDIFVLLYTIGGAQQDAGAVRDYTQSNDPDAAAGVALYTHDQLRAMAQFAVNLVDAMDTDSVITKFEYDKNLGNGWNLDDDPFTAEEGKLLPGDKGTPQRQVFDLRTTRGLYPEDTAGRGVVYGVESQQIAFSEVLAVRCRETLADDHAATPHDDSEEERSHLFVELKNVRPQALSLGTSHSNSPDSAVFRLARFDRKEAEAPLADPHRPSAAISFLEHAGIIRGGDLFTVATASDGRVASSDLFIDWNDDGVFELIAPDVASGALPTTSTTFTDATLPELRPRTNLDLIHPNHSLRRFVVTDDTQRVATEAGAFLSDMQQYRGNEPFQTLNGNRTDVGGRFVGDWSEAGFDLVIQRRLNPNLPSVRASAGQRLPVNPWIEVDRIRVEFKELGIKDSDTTEDLIGETGRLVQLTSRERREPLDDGSRQQFTVPFEYTDYRMHTIGGAYNTGRLRDPARPRNETEGPTHNPLTPSYLWQPHFDRDLTSPAELLQIPLFGPRLVTQRLNHLRQSPLQQIIRDAPSHQVSGAAALFLRPDFDPASDGDTFLNNRWYRLFQFVEVPSRVNRMLGNYLTRTKKPGMINLNMVRHQEVFAGLIDDPMFADTDHDRLESPFLSGRTPGSAYRDLWMEFLTERDGLWTPGFHDPTPELPNSGDEATRLLLPGTPSSRPFRSFNYTIDDDDDSGMQHTLLRTLMRDRDEDNDGDDDEVIPGKPEHDDDGDLIPDDDGLSGRQSTNRQWLEPGTIAQHATPGRSTFPVERYQVLSKVLNNTTTTSHTFVVFATAAYFEAWEDPVSGLYRIGGRIDLDGADQLNPGWQQRAVFVIDRAEAMDAYDPATRTFDWRRLVRYEAQIE